MVYEIRWSQESIDNLEDILEYLKSNWTEREILKFKNNLGFTLNLISKNPLMFPVSKYNKRLRMSVLSKQTSIFYEVQGQIIFLVYLFANKTNIEKVRNFKT